MALKGGQHLSLLMYDVMRHNMLLWFVKSFYESKKGRPLFGALLNVSQTDGLPFKKGKFRLVGAHVPNKSHDCVG